MHSVGFEPTPPKRLVPKTSALDRSAIQPLFGPAMQFFKICFILFLKKKKHCGS